MATNSHAEEKRGRVLSFPAGGRRGADRVVPRVPPVQDVEMYTQRRGEEERDDYRHRQVTNVIAFALCAILVIIGVWLADTMAQLRRDQDCVLAGRRNCANISILPGR